MHPEFGLLESQTMTCPVGPSRSHSPTFSGLEYSVALFSGSLGLGIHVEYETVVLHNSSKPACLPTRSSARVGESAFIRSQ